MSKTKEPSWNHDKMRKAAYLHDNMDVRSTILQWENQAKYLKMVEFSGSLFHSKGDWLTKIKKLSWSWIYPDFLNKQKKSATSIKVQMCFVGVFSSFELRTLGELS